MWAERGAALMLATLALAGCGEKPEPAAPRAAAVTGTLDLARPSPGPPDGGTMFGHRMADAIATTRRSALAFGGRVRPRAARVTLARAGGEPRAVTVGANGRFRARARRLKRGVNRFVVEGTAPGLRPWKADVSITRR
jgi:hypothetical protein